MKVQIIVIGLILYTGLVAGLSIFGAYGYITRGEATAVKDHFTEQQEKVAKVKQKDEKIDEAVSKRIEVIRYVQDPTGCSDTPAPVESDEQLYEIYKLATGS